MRLPKLEGKTGSTELNRQFLGYRHVDAPDEGAFYEMENVTSERYPLMAPRSPRAKLYTLQNPGGLCAKTALAWTENGKLYYGGEAVADVSEGEKTFVSMGAWLIVFPDGVRYNTADGTVDAIGQKNVTDGTVNFTLCEADGTAYSDYTVSETEPEDTTKYWLCTGSDPHCLKKYSAATKLWNTIPTTYVMISAAGIGKNLAEGDTVTVSGVLDSVGADLNGEMLLQQAADDAVVVVGFLDETASQTDAVTLERKAPKLDYVVECNNRLWGCSSEENEIYACKLGDATNWNCFAGLATDSYTVSVGSDGPFTGAAVQLGYVLFFKENCLHKVYGSKPSNFQVSMTACEGVQPGSAKSLCMVGSTLYYKADHGVMAYDGSVPESVSAALGGVYTQQRLFDGVRPGQRVDTDGRVGREPGVHRQERDPVVRGHRHQQRDVAGGDPERAENHDGGRHHHFLRGHPLPEIRMVARQQLSGHHDRAGGQQRGVQRKTGGEPGHPVPFPERVGRQEPHCAHRFWKPGHQRGGKPGADVLRCGQRRV